MTKHTEDITQEQKDAIRIIFNSSNDADCYKEPEELEKRIQELKEVQSSIRNSSLGRVTKLALNDDVEKAILRNERELELNHLHSELSSTKSKRGD